MEAASTLTTYLFVGREHSEPGAGGLVLLRSAQRPKGNGAATKLGEPALKLGLGRVVGKTRHVEHLAALRQKGPHIGTSVHGAREDVGVLVSRD